MVRVDIRLARAALLVAPLLASCKRPQPFAMPPAEVSADEVAPRSVPELVEFMGSVEPSRSGQVRSQVTGVILERPYVLASAVRASEALFPFDSTTDNAPTPSANTRLAEP